MAGSPAYLELLEGFKRPTKHFDTVEQAWENLEWAWDWFAMAQNETTLIRIAETCLVILEMTSEAKTRDDLLGEARRLHIAKNAGYAGQNPDPWSNIHFGVRAEAGVYVRMSDKYSRIKSLRSNPDNEQVGESILDTVRDLFAYSLIALCIRKERK
jgi:hypothetical protein